MLLGSNKPNKNVCCIVGRNVTKKRAAAVVVKHGLQELAPQGLALEQGAPHKRERQLGEVLDGGLAGLHTRVPYAEAFLSHNPELYEYLPLSDYRIKRSNEASTEHISQMLL